MPFELTVDKQELGSQAVYIHGLGEFGNGTHEISDAQEQNFRIANQTETAETDADPDSPTFGHFIHTHELGPSLVDAAESMHGVTVTDTSAGQKKSGAPVGSGARKAPVDNDTGGES